MKKKLLLFIWIGILLSANSYAQNGNTVINGASKIFQVSKDVFRGKSYNYATNRHYWAVHNGEIIGSNNLETVVIRRVDYSKEMSILYVGISPSGFYREAYMTISKNSDVPSDEIFNEYLAEAASRIKKILAGESLQPAIDW